MSEAQKKLQEIKDELDEKLLADTKRLVKQFEEDFMNRIQRPGVNIVMLENQKLSKPKSNE